MPGLNVVALISGGKDSFFSILHCHANGHKVTALANLHPSLENGERAEDIDSYMYQTIGHTVIPLYSEALGLPLYRQEILGGAVDQNKNYASPTSIGKLDETESLVPLLRKVMVEHPEVNAVCTGAILSDYQRTRVESVALRLGLVPLSYLWQYPFLPPYAETSLLDDMASAGQDARIIKVASGGLDDGFLWQNVADPRTKARLVRAMERFGIIGDGAALGEGGEFETLAVDGPWPLWKKAIHIEEGDRLVVAGDAGAASLKIRNATLVLKEPVEDFSYEQLRKPSVLDDKFAALSSRMGDLPEKSAPEADYTTSALDASSSWTIQKTPTATIISNATAPGPNASDQMTAIMTQLTSTHKVNPSSIAFTTILLHNMSDFSAVNAAYGAHFTTPNPPARVTIACGNRLPSTTLVSLSAVILHDDFAAQEQGLHVQSRSYWAPANIGPYSQAITMPPSSSSLPTTVHIAGQIPLDPSSMEFPPRNNMTASDHFQLQTILSLQHLWRIGQITQVSHWTGAVAFIPRVSEATVTSRVAIALRAWELALMPEVSAEDDEDEDEDVDVWDRVHGQQFQTSASTTSTKRKDIVNASAPPCFVAEVETLPRDAPIEWASTGLKSSSDVETKEIGANGHSHNILTTKSGLDDAVVAGWIAVKNLDELAKVDFPADSVCTVYTRTLLPDAWVKERQPTIIPCYRLWDSKGEAVECVMAYRMQ